MNYRIDVTWSAADQAFIATVPDLPGCMADGATEAEARRAAAAIAGEWIETAVAAGRTVPSPSNTR